MAAPLGLHRVLLVYPARALYSLFTLLILLFSFGRIRLQTPLRGAIRRGRQRRRSWQSALTDWRRGQEEERVIWSSGEEGGGPFAFLKDDDK